jgi:hypothetical protein
MIQKNYITKEEADRQRFGGERLGPGVWDDGEGGLHFSVPEILAAFGWPNDPEHCAIVEKAIHDVIRENCPTAKIVEQEIL